MQKTTVKELGAMGTDAILFCCVVGVLTLGKMVTA
jgi:hypothetical protein